MTGMQGRRTLWALSFHTLHRARTAGAAAALLLAVAYLAGYQAFAVAGFVLLGLAGGVTGVLINRGMLPALCDLCGRRGTFSAEYGQGFRNARLILACPRCGRVVNRADHGVDVEREGNPKEP